MRFSIAAAAFMATAASAGSIVYLTEEVTITSWYAISNAGDLLE